MLGFLKRFLDPWHGPLGSILSPSIVFKDRQNIALSVPKAIYAQAPQTTLDLEKVTFGEKTMSADAEVPTSRVRAVSAFVEERYRPIYDSTKSTDLFEILKASQTLIGWKVTLHARKEAKAKAPMTAEEFVEHVQSLHIPRLADEAYNVYLDSFAGNDPCIVDGEILRGEATYDEHGKMTHDGVIRGGTQIRHGRREYNRVTKDAVTWDKGYIKQRFAALAEQASRPVRNVQRALDAQKGESLPTWRPVGINFRKDRRSAV